MCVTNSCMEHLQLPASVTKHGQDGEAMTLPLVRKYGDRVILYNANGPSEATSVMMFKHMKSSDEQVSIGRPIQHCSAYVMGDDMILTAEGDVGQLCIGGKCVSRGDLDGDATTNARCINSS